MQLCRFYPLCRKDQPHCRSVRGRSNGSFPFHAGAQPAECFMEQGARFLINKKAPVSRRLLCQKTKAYDSSALPLQLPEYRSLSPHPHRSPPAVMNAFPVNGGSSVSGYLILRSPGLLAGDGLSNSFLPRTARQVSEKVFLKSRILFIAFFY